MMLIILLTLSPVFASANTVFDMNSEYDSIEFFENDINHSALLSESNLIRRGVEGLIDVLEDEVKSMQMERNLGPYAVISTMNGIEYKLDITKRKKSYQNYRKRTLHLFVGSVEEERENYNYINRNHYNETNSDLYTSRYNKYERENDLVVGAMIRIDLFKK